MQTIPSGGEFWLVDGIGSKGVESVKFRGRQEKLRVTLPGVRRPVLFTRSKLSLRDGPPWLRVDPPSRRASAQQGLRVERKRS
jgi:hypothetical protein